MIDRTPGSDEGALRRAIPHLRRWLWSSPRRALAFSLILALITRLLGIASRPLWYDEAFAVLFAEKGPSAMLIGTLAPTAAGSADVHPLGYYTVLWVWMRLFGESAIAVRALSILAGLGTIVVMYALAAAVFDRQAAFASAVLLALAPFQVHYGQEIRMYSFLGMWLAIATYCYWQASRSTGWPWWAGFAASAAAAQYTHNLAAFHLFALALWPVFTRQWQTVVKVGISGVAAALIYLPWLVHLPAQFTKVDLAYWIESPGAYRLLSLLLAYVTNIPLRNELLGVGLFAAFSSTALAIQQTVRAVMARSDGFKNGLWVLYLAFAAPLMMFVFSQWKPVYLERALLPAGAIFMLWMGWTLSRTGIPAAARNLMMALLAVGFGIGIFQHVVYRGFPYAPFAAIADDVRTNALPGDAVVHSSKLSMLPLVYYDRSLPQRYVSDPPGSAVDTLAASTQEVLGLRADGNIEAAVGSADRVWFLIFKESNQEYLLAAHREHPHLGWLKDHFQSWEVQHWDSLDLYLFVRST